MRAPKAINYQGQRYVRADLRLPVASATLKTAAKPTPEWRVAADAADKFSLLLFDARLISPTFGRENAADLVGAALLKHRKFGDGTGPWAKLIVELIKRHQVTNSILRGPLERTEVAYMTREWDKLPEDMRAVIRDAAAA